MTPDQLRAIALAELSAIAPEADLKTLDEGADLRDALDLDSMDILRFATALHARLGIEIPESDYPSIVSMRGCVSYLGARVKP
jgi:acyl carrier protein